MAQIDATLLEALRPARNATPHWVVHVKAIDNDNHHAFQVVTTAPHESSKVGRTICSERYSRLLVLHRECSAQFPEATPTTFPKKKMFGRLNTKVVLQRAEALAEYFEEAMYGVRFSTGNYTRG
jgi:hypothetical protein